MATEPAEADAGEMQRQLVWMSLGAVWPQLDWSSCAAVLHVGCGVADVTVRELLPRLPDHLRVVAADRSRSAVAGAAARFAAAAPRLSFLQLHIATRRIKHTAVWGLGPYSKVFSFFSLQWEQHQRRAIRNIGKLLCSGGETVIVLVSRSILFAMYMNLAKSTKWRTHLEDYQQCLSPYQFSDNPADDLNTYLQQAGLTVKTCYEQEILYVTEKESVLKETMAAINPFLSRIPLDMRETFQRDCEEEVLKKGGVIAKKQSTSETIYSLKYSALVAHALKM